MNTETDKANRSWLQMTGLIAGPILSGAVLIFSVPHPDHPAAMRMLAVACLMATWWITEAIPISVTALIPMVLYPLLGVMSARTTAPVYFNSTIFLFIGGFMIALTMEKWNLHKRIALRIIRFIGGGPSRIVLGFMCAAAFLSMWISNTATAVMMLPIGLAIIYKMEAAYKEDVTHNFSISLMLGIAYACSVGGIATLVGTPPNLSFARIYQITFPQAPAISFGQWLIMGLPLTVLMLGFIWFLLTKIIYRPSSALTVDHMLIRKEHQALGPMSYEEKAVMTVFALTAFLWVFRKKLVIGSLTIPGWSQWIPYANMVDDGSVAMTMALLLFLIPARNREAGNIAIADAGLIAKLPWAIVLLFGGGFALARGFQETGLSVIIGEKFSGFSGFPVFLMIGILCLTITFMTELTSNTATTEMILPILAAVAVGMNIHPLLLMVPATLSASCAFMMPVATPPNAIVFGSNRITIAQMARAGIIINLAGVILITAFFYVVGTTVFHIDLTAMPDWAVHSTVGMMP